MRNKANAPVSVALGITDPEQLLEADFDKGRRVEVPAGQTTTSEMTVKPPKQIWIGRPSEHRFEVLTKTGEAADEMLAGEDEVIDEEYEDDDLYEDEEEAEGGGDSRAREEAKKRGKKYKPRVQGPRVQVGPGGVRATGPKATGAKPRAPRVPSKSFDLNSLKKKGGGGGGRSADAGLHRPAAADPGRLPPEAVDPALGWRSCSCC